MIDSEQGKKVRKVYSGPVLELGEFRVEMVVVKSLDKGECFAEGNLQIRMEQGMSLLANFPLGERKAQTDRLESAN